MAKRTKRVPPQITVLAPSDEDSLAVLIEENAGNPPWLGIGGEERGSDYAVDLTPEKADRIAAGLIAWAASARAKR